MKGECRGGVVYEIIGPVLSTHVLTLANYVCTCIIFLALESRHSEFNLTLALA